MGDVARQEIKMSESPEVGQINKPQKIAAFREAVQVPLRSFKNPKIQVAVFREAAV